MKRKYLYSSSSSSLPKSDRKVTRSIKLDFPLVALFCGMATIFYGAFMENRDVILVGGGFVTAAGTAYVQNKQGYPSDPSTFNESIPDYWDKEEEEEEEEEY